MFNSFLIQGKFTALMHTGSINMWPDLREAVLKLIPMREIDFVIVPHFESDECGALRNVIADTGAETLASTVGARQIKGFGLTDDVKEMQDGDRLDLGKGHMLEFVSVPSEMHLWEGLMVFDHGTGTLFSNDFLSQMGSNVGFEEDKISIDLMRQMNKGNIPHPEPFQRTLKRLNSLDIKRVAPGHGSVINDQVHALVQRYFTADFEVGKN